MKNFLFIEIKVFISKMDSVHVMRDDITCDAEVVVTTECEKLLCPPTLCSTALVMKL